MMEQNSDTNTTPWSNPHRALNSKSNMVVTTGKKPSKQGNLFSFFSKKEKPIATVATIAAPTVRQSGSHTTTATCVDSNTTMSQTPVFRNLPESTKNVNQSNQFTQSHPKDASSDQIVGSKDPSSLSLIQQIQLDGDIEVYWVDDDEWYKAKVTKQKQNSTTFYIKYYIDGQCEWIDLSTESFRFCSTATTGVNVRKRHFLKKDTAADGDDSVDEGEFILPPSDDDEDAESEFVDTGTDEEEEHDQWMVTDDEDETVSKKKRMSDPRKIDSKANKRHKENENRNSLASKSLQKFAAGGPTCPIAVTQHSLMTQSKMTPNHSQQQNASNAILHTPKHITPTTSVNAELSRKRDASSMRVTADGDISSSSKSVSTPIITTNFNKKQQKGASQAPPNFEVGALNPAGSHVHNHLPFLQCPRDANGRTNDDPNYDPRTLFIQESDWIRITGKKMTDAVKQWWDLKAMYFDTVLLFKTGKFYEMFHMDADIGVQICGLSYMKGHVAHAGFPEISYGAMADKLVRGGYKVARVEQTETPEQLGLRKKSCARGAPAPKVVNREVCSIMTMGTRTFCYLDDESSLLLTDDLPSSSTIGPLLAIREITLQDNNQLEENDDSIQPVCEYGITLIDAIRGTVTIGQFADDVLRSRLVTLFTSYSPSEVLIEGGENGASDTLRLLLKSLQSASSARTFLIETIQPTESFPQSTAIDPHVRKQLGRAGNVFPWNVPQTLAELHRRQYFPKASKLSPSNGNDQNVSRWPKVLRAAVEGNAELALSSFGAALFYLQRNLIDGELLSMGNVLAYIPPNTTQICHENTDASSQIDKLAMEQSFIESGITPTELVSPMRQIDAVNDDDINFMALDGTTLHNLEILTNAVDQKVNGSLWSKINYTKTPHGSRLLRAWLLRPLFQKTHIERRLDAVEELIGGGAAMALTEARAILSKCGDIERLLCRVHSMSGGINSNVESVDGGDRIHPNDRAVLYETATYTKRKVGDFAKVLYGLRHASQIPELFSGVEIRSGLVKKIVQFTDQGGCFPRIAENLDWFFQNFDLDQAAKGFFEPGKGIDELYDSASDEIDRILAELNDYKEQMCASVLTPRALAKSTWKYINTKVDSKDKYFIELPANVNVPETFVMKGKRGTGPKQVNKYQSPEVEDLVTELERAYDVQKVRKAKGMELIFGKFDAMRDIWAAVSYSTALLDALGALAQTASKVGYTRPVILSTSSSPSIKVIQGRHPCVEHTFNSSEFIPNDLHLGCSSSSNGVHSARVLLLSGPNMGGKSTLLRQTCLISILAQIGCFVPAEHCELTPVDRIYTRLGASDRILVNQSTFFVELAETAAALRGASHRSLVIMDELGRGTSTFDGTAIASATVQHLVQHNKCLTLFATHYHSLLDEWKENTNVKLGHMECLVENKSLDSSVDDCNITFLYTLGNGACPKSFGINVARLAGLPDTVLMKAKRISADFELETNLAKSSEETDSEQTKQKIVRTIMSCDWNNLKEIWDNLANTRNNFH